MFGDNRAGHDLFITVYDYDILAKKKYQKNRINSRNVNRKMSSQESSATDPQRDGAKFYEDI